MQCVDSLGQSPIYALCEKGYQLTSKREKSNTTRVEILKIILPGRTDRAHFNEGDTGQMANAASSSRASLLEWLTNVD